MHFRFDAYSDLLDERRINMFCIVVSSGSRRSMHVDCTWVDIGEQRLCSISPPPSSAARVINKEHDIVLA